MTLPRESNTPPIGRSVYLSRSEMDDVWMALERLEGDLRAVYFILFLELMAIVLQAAGVIR